MRIGSAGRTGMMILFAVAVTASSAAGGFWGWPPHMQVEPPCISPASSVVVTLSGEWPDSGRPYSAQVIRAGHDLDINLSAHLGVLPVITPWSLPVEVGQLPAGTYWVYVAAFDGPQQLRPRELVGTFIVDPACAGVCYANCDASTMEPTLNVDDFTCFINEFAAAQSLPHEQQIEHYANCDGSTAAPVLNVDDFTCFIDAFAAGCP